MILIWNRGKEDFDSLTKTGVKKKKQKKKGKPTEPSLTSTLHCLRSLGKIIKMFLWWLMTNRREWGKGTVPILWPNLWPTSEMFSSPVTKSPWIAGLWNEGPRQSRRANPTSSHQNHYKRTTQVRKPSQKVWNKCRIPNGLIWGLHSYGFPSSFWKKVE